MNEPQPTPTLFDWIGGQDAFDRLTEDFLSAFLPYVEWGTRLALANSQPGATPPPRAPVPRWGWGEAPPFTGD
jgi:hypothetical protein